MQMSIGVHDGAAKPVTESTEQRFSEPDSLTDAVLLVQGRKLYISKYFLAAASPVLRDIVITTKVEEEKMAQIPLEGHSYNTWLFILNYLHTKIDCTKKMTVNMVSSRERAIELLAVAHKFQLGCLSKECQDIIMEESADSTLDELFHALCLAVKLGMRELSANIAQNIHPNLYAFEDELYKNLPDSVKVFLLEHRLKPAEVCAGVTKLIFKNNRRN